MKLSSVRVPCVLEVDVTTGPIERKAGDDFVSVPISATSGRIVTEDGTVLVAFDLSED